MILKSYTDVETVKAADGIIISQNNSSATLNVIDGYEVCILCGKQTQYSSKTPIDKRQYYVEGGGQMCRDCYKEVYKAK